MLVLALTLALTTQPPPSAAPGGDVLDPALRSTLLAAAPRWTMPQIDAVARAIQDSGLPAELVLGLMHTESRFRRRAQSGRGARGVMQLMPSTARAFAARAGVVWRGLDTLDDPAASVRIGATYLRHLLDRFGGDQALALAAYSHGPTRIRRALRAHGHLSARAHGYGRRVRQHEAHYAAALLAYAPAPREVDTFSRSVAADPRGPREPVRVVATWVPSAHASHPTMLRQRAAVYAATDQARRRAPRASGQRDHHPALL